MAATVGKYVLKAADNAADWVQGIKFGKNADIVTDNDAVLVVDLDGLERQLSYSKTGRDKLMEPGGIIDPTTDLDRSQQYANFVEFAESTDQPIHMPIVKVDADGEIDLADGSVSLAALRDAGLKEIPVVIPKDEVGAIPVHMLSNKWMVTAKNADIPVTKPIDYTPKKLTPAQQKVFKYNVEQLGFPASTAKSIALGELPMDSASRAARRAEGGFTEKMYHGGSGNIVNLEINRDGFWNSRNPIVSNMYTSPMPEMNSAMYELAFNPSRSGYMSAGNLGWRELDGLNTDITLPGGKVVNTVDDLNSGRSVTGEEFEDTNDLARLAKGMRLSAMEITDLIDPGHNSRAAREAFKDSVAKVNPGATQSQLDNEWSKFLQEYEEWGDTNITVVDPTTVRSATGAAYDKRNRAMPNIMGGSAALAIALGANDSEAAVERLNAIMEGRMSPSFKSPAAQAQTTITGKAPVTPTQEVVYRTMSENFDPNPDVGSITGVSMNPVSQAAGNVGFALQGFGDRAASAGPLGWMAGTAIKDLGEISQRAAYGESKATDPAMAVLDILALTPGAYMSQGMRTAMSDKDVGSMIFRELLK